jgi:hypothetical protein
MMDVCGTRLRNISLSKPWKMFAPVAGVVLAVLLLVLLATWIPAQRALSEDPLRLLREECSRILCEKPHTWGL